MMSQALFGMPRLWSVDFRQLALALTLQVYKTYLTYTIADQWAILCHNWPCYNETQM